MAAKQIRLKDYALNEKKLKNKKIKLHLLDKTPLTTFEILRLALTYVFLVFWTFVILFPVASLLAASFNVYNPRYVTLSPFRGGLQNFTYLFTSNRSHFTAWYGNTLMISLATMFLTVVFVAFTGYAYSRFKFAGSKSSLAAVMLIQMIPATASLISLYIIVKMGKSIGIDPRIMLVMVYSGAAIAGNTFVLKGYLDSISTDLDDAAKIDGCGNWRLFVKVLVPISWPMLAIIALWSFLTPFNDVILPKFVIIDLAKTTLPVGLDSFLSAAPKDVNAGAYAAGAVLASLPPLMLFMYLQRFVVGGIGEGGVK